MRAEDTKTWSCTHLVRIIHTECDALALKVIYIHYSGFTAALRSVYELQLPWPGCNEVCRTILTKT